MFGAIARIAGKALSTVARGTVSSVRSVSNVPILKDVAKQTAIGGALYGAGNMLFGGKSSSGLPDLAGLPAMPGGMNPVMGQRGIFQNDPDVIEAVKPWAISKANLKVCYRAPKGFVIVYDSVGDPYALPRRMAMWLKLWKPGAKPPISVGDWQAVKRADRTVKKMRKVFRTTTRVDKSITGGKVNVTGRKKGGK